MTLALAILSRLKAAKRAVLPHEATWQSAQCVLEIAGRQASFFTAGESKSGSICKAAAAAIAPSHMAFECPIVADVKAHAALAAAAAAQPWGPPPKNGGHGAGMGRQAPLCQHACGGTYNSASR